MWTSENLYKVVNSGANAVAIIPMSAYHESRDTFRGWNMDSESFEAYVARVNSNSFISPPNPTGAIIMAKPVKLAKGKEFNFSVSKGAVSKYPWDEWFSGELLLLERSEGTEDEKGTIIEPTEKRDYEVLTDAMPPKIKTAARRRYKVVQVSRMDPNEKKLKDALIIKARDMSPQECQDEDILRAEEKEVLKAKKAAKRTGASQSEASASEEAA
jgi:hypothetical protein